MVRTPQVVNDLANLILDEAVKLEVIKADAVAGLRESVTEKVSSVSALDGKTLETLDLGALCQVRYGMGSHEPNCIYRQLGRQGAPGLLRSGPELRNSLMWLVGFHIIRIQFPNFLKALETSFSHETQTMLFTKKSEFLEFFARHKSYAGIQLGNIFAKTTIISMANEKDPLVWKRSGELLFDNPINQQRWRDIGDKLVASTIVRQTQNSTATPPMAANEASAADPAEIVAEVCQRAVMTDTPHKDFTLQKVFRAAFKSFVGENPSGATSIKVDFTSTEIVITRFHACQVSYEDLNGFAAMLAEAWNAKHQTAPINTKVNNG